MPTEPFRFSDAASFAANIEAFTERLNEASAPLAGVLAPALDGIGSGHYSRDDLLDGMLTALKTAETVDAAPASDSADTPADDAAAPPPAASPPQPAAPARWFLSRIQIEGFRGINNEGVPLSLKFLTDGVNSVSAPNGVGKTSVYDALAYALTGRIEKLDRLKQVERGHEYYLNRFHPGDGTVVLTLAPDNGAAEVSVTIQRSSAGVRTVTTSDGSDGEALLQELNREFVLLDGPTFQSFIDYPALERGRTFAGLLGLARYSDLRQGLQALSNTRAFNTHFDVTARAGQKANADRRVAAARTSIAADYAALVKEALDPTAAATDAQSHCQAALESTPVLKDHCVDRAFLDVDVDACIEAVRAEEGGEKKDRYSQVLRDLEAWRQANVELPLDADLLALVDLAAGRDEALAATAGEVVSQLLRLGETVVGDESWTATLCPVCDNDAGEPVINIIQGKLAQFDAVDALTKKAAEAWGAGGFAELAALETLALKAEDVPHLRTLSIRGAAGALTMSETENVGRWVGELRARATAAIDALSEEKHSLESELPPSLVAVTTAVEAARRLQASWRELAEAEHIVADEVARAGRVEKVKAFLDQASRTFARAESDLATERLRAVQPVCQTIFKEIMFSDVVPALDKPAGSEEMSIRLESFWGLQDQSAQALLSESFRNGFAVSVYLAAASLYGGAPRFMVLDDVTSSLDAGHQHHLVEVIRTKFARPAVATGPQVIILSHDTILEKLFNKHAGSPTWSHQRLEGTARTSVLTQAGAVNKVRDATLDLLNQGRVIDAAPRIRQYLEYILAKVIDRCRIPVPMDLVFADEKHTPGAYLEAINAAVDLHTRAGDLVLDAAQVAALNMNSGSIVGNYLAHWSTGQTQTFSAPALLGVMQAIDRFSDSFTYEPTPGAQRKFYRSLSQR